ncbi:MAG: SusC/RagA family TonB-linked outer membrane protein [Flavobacteriaceae bacterium]|jgi:TonB-linked SusC/RagA family outer membrane protein
MKTKFNGILTLFLALIVQISFAQQRTISGTVFDESGPLPGVSIIIKGSTNGTETNFDGNYSIRVNKGAILVFNYLGYKIVERKIENSNVVNVTLSVDANVLKEIIVTGYTTTSKAKASTASTQIDASTIENRPNGAIVQTLAGQVAGLDISTSSGQPGANSLVQLRGTNSINGNTEPLFIMDGTPINEDNFRSMNPNEIASITVLKDAGATAIYGSRGANGVIIIKTKGGKKNSGLKVRYNSVLSFSSIQGSDYNLLDSQGYATLERTKGNGLGAGDSVGVTYDSNGGPLTDVQIAALPNQDWGDVFLRTGLTQNHTMSFTSGGENSTQYTSLGYFKQEGILKKSNLQRFNLRNNMTGEAGKFKYATNLSLNFSKNDSPTGIGTSGINRNPFFGANLGLPYLTAADRPTSQEIADNLIFGYSPYMVMDVLFFDKAVQDELKIIASLNGSYDFSENLTATVTSGVDYESEVTLDTQDPRGFNQLYFNPNSAGTQSQRSYRTAAFNTTAALNWNKEIGKHTIGVGLYSEYFKAHFRYFGFTANGLNPKTFFPGDGSGFIDDNATNDLFVDTVGADMKDAGLLSYFTNMNYDYDSKYGMSLTYRRDASYRFSKTNRWADFWAVSARWNIDKENFMEDSVFNSLKLRGSYGTSGNQRISGSNYFSAPDLASNFFATGTGYAGAQTIALSQLGNDTLKWETVAQANVGIDFALFNSRLRGSFDYYRKETTDLFQSLPLSAITGTSSLASNTGSLHNNGFDFDLTYDLVRGADLNVSLTVVGNINDNYLADLPSETGIIEGIGRNGGPIFERYEVRYAGVNPANGNEMFLDIDGNLTETPNPDTDRVWSGKNIAPEMQGSFSLNADYKGFFIQSQFNYTVGVDFSDSDYARLMNGNNISQFNLSSDILRSWTPENRVTDVPNIQNGSNAGVYSSNRFLVDRDYLRLRFLSFGYNFPKEYLAKSNISNLRLFLNGENLITFTKFRGFDASSRVSGLEYPTAKIVSLGLEISL